MTDDHTLQSLVSEELEWEPSLDAAHIGVTARNGVVTLSGFVESFVAKAAAERAARRVRGVKAIAQEIEVRLPNHQRRADDEIAERAMRILAWDVEVPGNRIQVKVEHGMMILTGDVTYQFQRAAAETAVRRLTGIRAVYNMIRVVPTLEAESDPDVVRQRIENALRRSAELEAEQIRIRVDGGRVSLRGEVRSWFERSAAEDAAWAAPGVTDVRNEIEVSPW